MQKQTVMLTVIILIAVFGWTGCNSIQHSNLNSVEPIDVGLSWQECPVTEGSATEGFDWKQAESCFGHPMPLWNDEEKVNFGIQTDMENLRLTIGDDIYETRINDNLFPKQKYTLYKNGNAVQSLSGEFFTFSPNRSLQNIGGKAVWEFSDGNTATVIYDGTDVRNLYDLDKAYSPYGIDGKLIFVGEKDSNYFIVYDGHKVGSNFDKVMIAYCCEPMLWSVQYGKGRYLFWSLKNEQWHITEITSSQK
jgi:hypothetical protein